MFIFDIRIYKNTIMRFLSGVLIILIFVVSCSNNQSRLSENSILGTWECIFGCDADIYVFSKSKQGFEFTAFKQQNILKTGNYQCSDSTIRFSYPDGIADMFKASLQNDSLILDDGRIILKRYIENTDFSNHTDQLIGEVESLLEVFPDFDYGNQEPVDFTYKLKVSENQFDIITIKGFGVKSKVMLAGEFLSASDVLNPIYSVLIEQGFVNDKDNNTENCKVYCEKNMVVEICSIENHISEFEGELEITVNFGFID